MKARDILPLAVSFAIIGFIYRDRPVTWWDLGGSLAVVMVLLAFIEWQRAR
jgi:hypothetical protein